MFSRPFMDFEPGPDELAAGASVREVFIGRIQRCVDAGLLSGDVTDIAHVLLALAQGLAVQELGRWLGPSGPSVERRWKLGVGSLLAGFRAPADGPRQMRHVGHMCKLPTYERLCRSTTTAETNVSDTVARSLALRQLPPEASLPTAGANLGQLPHVASRGRQQMMTA